MKKLSKYIDHTNLKPDAQQATIEKLCADAREWDFASVCVNPCNIPLAKKLLKDSGVMVCTVIGFPLGQNTTKIKVAETKDAYKMGCDEFDMVINTPTRGRQPGRDGFKIRRKTVEHSIPCLTSLDTAKAYIRSMKSGVSREELNMVNLIDV